MPEEFYPGRRLSFSGSLCTVRYIGSVKSTSGEWLGVEWDNASRGKHDGSHERVKYFDCESRASTAGSFIRPSRPQEPPLSFFEALRSKYAAAESESPGSAAEIEISGKIVEEVGFDKIREQLAILQELRIVLLDGLRVGGVLARPWTVVGSAELRLQERQRIEDQKLKIVELDLSRNLIEEWAEVADICGTLKCLRSLKMNGNRFRNLSLQNLRPDQHSFSKVQELSLDDTLLPWDSIVYITSFFPLLTTLSASSNALTSLTDPLQTPNLKTLTLSFNLLPSLPSLSPLTSLPQLTSLSLRSNPFTITSSPQLRFPVLNSLDLTSTLIPSLPHLSTLPQSFPALSSLLTSKTPISVLASSSLLTVARLPSLTSLNFSRITPAERQNAELYYLSQIARELSASALACDQEKTTTQRILDENPRYPDLCRIYGEPEIAKKGSSANDPEEGTLGARLVKFTFYMRGRSEGTTTTAAAAAAAAAAAVEVEEKRKEIPRSVDVYRLKGIVGPLFGIRPLRCKLIWETDEWDPVAREEEGWSCSEDDEEEEVVEEKAEEAAAEQQEGSGKVRKEKWSRREMELVDGTRKIGVWIDGREARVRVELR